MAGSEPGAPVSGPVSRAELQQLVPLLQAGRHAEIEQRAQALIGRDPLCGGAWKALGVALELQQKDSLAALRRAVELLPEDADALAALGGALLRADRGEEAIPWLRQAAALRPTDPDLHANLGNALRAAGRLEDALGCYRESARLAPGRAELQGNVAHTLWQLGRPEEASACYRQGLALRPHQADLLAGLAVSLASMGRPGEGLEPAQLACARAPQSADAFNTLGGILLDLGRDAEAEAAFRTALRVRPGFVQAQGNLATALRLQGRAAEALEMARSTLELDPRSVPVRIVMAEALADGGDFSEAEQALQEALAIEPDSAQACAGIAHLRRMGPSDAGWLMQAQRIAVQPGLAPRLQVQLYYAMGKYHDDLQDYSRAFECYRAANERSRRQRPPYEPARWEAEVMRLTRHYDRAWLERMNGVGNRSVQPLLIVGMPRSGTSLVEQILASHPAVKGAGELPFWSLAAGAPAPESSAETPDAVARLGREYLAELARHSPTAGRVTDKMPENFQHLGLIHAALPGARIIHVMRHPVDNCLSIYFQDFKAGLSYATDLAHLAHYYRHYRRLMAHWRSLLPADALLEISYEFLISHQEDCTRGMLEFVGLPWDARCLEFQTTRRSVSTASRWQVRQKINAASMGRWRRYEPYVGELLPLLVPDEAK